MSKTVGTVGGKNTDHKTHLPSDLNEFLTVGRRYGGLPLGVV